MSRRIFGPQGARLESVGDLGGGGVSECLAESSVDGNVELSLRGQLHDPRLHGPVL